MLRCAEGMSFRARMASFALSIRTSFAAGPVNDYDSGHDNILL